ncbi:MAG: M15 family metallopeptidase [Gammaproteobacteria bacterium]|nr:M15 family metallopeptidase [Gammaproteobacteria bacterium]
MTPEELTGRALGHLVEVRELGCSLHRDACAAFMAMRRAASAAGLEPRPVSAFRDFGRQLELWNGKYRGDRPVRDAAGALVDLRPLGDDARIDAILLWTALPGASRHHWGTDLDLIDGGALARGYSPRLEPGEYAGEGPFAPLAAWLESHAGRFGFFRPYRGLRSGVRPEPWHYSFAPVADEAVRRLGIDVLREALEAAPLEGRAAVLSRLAELHARFVVAIDPF